MKTLKKEIGLLRKKLEAMSPQLQCFKIFIVEFFFIAKKYLRAITRVNNFSKSRLQP